VGCAVVAQQEVGQGGGAVQSQPPFVLVVHAGLTLTPPHDTATGVAAETEQWQVLLEGAGQVGVIQLHVETEEEGLAGQAGGTVIVCWADPAATHVTEAGCAAEHTQGGVPVQKGVQAHAGDEGVVLVLVP